MNRCAEHPRGDPCPLLPEWAQAQIATLQSQLAEREAELKRRELKIQQLTLELAHHRRIRFGARSEVLGAEQRELFLDSRAEDEAAILAELEQQRAARPARQAKRTGRHPLPPALPRIEHRHEPASCTCGACGAGLVKIGEDKARRQRRFDLGPRHSGCQYGQLVTQIDHCVQPGAEKSPGWSSETCAPNLPESECDCTGIWRIRQGLRGSQPAPGKGRTGLFRTD